MLKNIRTRPMTGTGDLDRGAASAEFSGMKSPREFPAAYSQAVRDASVEAYTALYDESVRIFDHWDAWQMKGRDACEKTATEWFSSLGDEHVVVTFSDIEVKDGDSVALLTAFVRFAGHAADGEQLRFLDERMTVGFRKQASGDWLVSHQHTSAPTDSSNMKSKMVRE